MIDPRAVVHPDARLGEGVRVEPFAVIGPEVEIGDHSWIGPHALVKGPTRIGAHNKIYPFASVGEAPQDKKYAGEPTRLEIGDHNVIREYCTINRGTIQDRGVTRIGDHNWIMAYVHIAHDCQVGDHTVFANNASLAGHVIVEDHAILGGFTLVHQFCRIGAHAFTAMGSALTKDVPPFVMAAGNPARARGLNLEGLRRRGFSTEAVACLKQAYRLIYRSDLPLSRALERIEDELDCDQSRRFAAFIRASRRGIV